MSSRLDEAPRNNLQALILRWYLLIIITSCYSVDGTKDWGIFLRGQNYQDFSMTTPVASKISMILIRTEALFNDNFIVKIGMITQFARWWISQLSHLAIIQISLLTIWILMKLLCCWIENWWFYSIFSYRYLM